jgi:hypothetical protein
MRGEGGIAEMAEFEWMLTNRSFSRCEQTPGSRAAIHHDWKVLIQFNRKAKRRRKSSTTKESFGHYEEVTCVFAD